MLRSNQRQAQVCSAWTKRPSRPMSRLERARKSVSHSTVMTANNADHDSNYLPHNGIASFQQLVHAQQAVFATGNDTSHLLAAYGVAMSGSGDINLISIGGPPPEDLAPISEQLRRKPLGLSSEHASFEFDASPTRGDLYIRYVSVSWYTQAHAYLVAVIPPKMFNKSSLRILLSYTKNKIKNVPGVRTTTTLFWVCSAPNV